MKLVVSNISKIYDKKNILKNVNFELQSGEILALVGRNGSGKTTLLRILASMVNKDTGNVYLDSVDIEENMHLKSELIFIPDRFDYFLKTKLKKISSYYKLIYSNFDENYFYREIEKLGLDKNKTLNQFSKGEKVLFSVVLSLACNTKFIFLDEPLDGLDVINTDNIFDYLLDAQEKGVGIIISSHRLEYLEKVSNKIYYLEKNELKNSVTVSLEDYKKYQVVYAEDLPKKIKQRNDVLILNQIGRVFTLFLFDPDDDFENVIKETSPIHYDILGATLEDVFLYKNRKEN